MMNEKEVETLLKETKAILEGHFLLTSGLHSPLYVEKFNVLQHPEHTENFAGKLQNISRTRESKQLSDRLPAELSSRRLLQESLESDPFLQNVKWQDDTQTRIHHCAR